MKNILSIAAITFALFSGTAWAQDDGGEERRVQYQARTEIDFDGVEVAGELVRPQGGLVVERKRANFNPLINLRTDFNQEMSESVDEVK